MLHVFNLEQTVTQRPHTQSRAHIVIYPWIIRPVQFHLPVGIDAIDLLTQVLPHHAGAGRVAPVTAGYASLQAVQAGDAALKLGMRMVWLISLKVSDS